MPLGKPFAVFVRFVQVRPASVLLYNALPAPPLDIDHGVRPDCQNATYSTSGFDGSNWKSIAPVESFANRMLLHVFPASVDIHTPSPWETLPRMHVSPPPTHTTSGFFGSTAIAPIVPLK